MGEPQVTLRNNITGKAEVLEYIKSYFDKWDFERVETFGATNDKEGLAFSVSIDKVIYALPGRIHTRLLYLPAIHC